MTLQQSIKLGGWLRRRAENVLVALLSIMFVTFIIQIFFRYVLNNPVGWTEEVIVTTWLSLSAGVPLSVTRTVTS